jgi:hypothetical protein
MSKRLTTEASRWVEGILDEDFRSTGEIVVWDISVMVFPDLAAAASTVEDSADPSAIVPLPVVVLYLELPGASPDTSVYMSPILAPFGLTEQTVQETVGEALESLRRDRGKLLDKPENAATLARLRDLNKK